MGSLWVLGGIPSEEMVDSSLFYSLLPLDCEVSELVFPAHLSGVLPCKGPISH